MIVILYQFYSLQEEDEEEKNQQNQRIENLPREDELFS
jgi:hypothetical protein